MIRGWRMVFENGLSMSTLLHLLYLLASATILLTYFIPSLHSRLLQYGARSSQPDDETSGSTSKLVQSRCRLVLDQIARIRVPHYWFLHFYVVSTAMSIFWFQEVFWSGKVLAYIASFESPPQTSMTSTQLMLTWSLMSLQSLRRLYESLVLLKPSTSSMWIGHYLVGISFYLAVNISVWVEALPLQFEEDWDTAPSLLTHNHRSFFCLVTFFSASIIQHHTHVYLSKLEKYTLPISYPFDRIISPHYTAECIIYLSLAVLAAPPGTAINRSLSSATIFVWVNLGVSADITKSWMLQEFPNRPDEVERRWRMIPGLW